MEEGRETAHIVKDYGGNKIPRIQSIGTRKSSQMFSGQSFSRTLLHTSSPTNKDCKSFSTDALDLRSASNSFVKSRGVQESLAGTTQPSHALAVLAVARDLRRRLWWLSVICLGGFRCCQCLQPFACFGGFGGFSNSSKLRRKRVAHHRWRFWQKEAVTMMTPMCVAGGIPP